MEGFSSSTNFEKTTTGMDSSFVKKWSNLNPVFLRKESEKYDTPNQATSGIFRASHVFGMVDFSELAAAKANATSNSNEMDTSFVSKWSSSIAIFRKKAEPVGLNVPEYIQKRNVFFKKVVSSMGNANERGKKEKKNSALPAVKTISSSKPDKPKDGKLRDYHDLAKYSSKSFTTGSKKKVQFKSVIDVAKINFF